MRTVLVGAGSAGCVLAARLSENPDHEVVVLEAGGSDRTTLCRKPGMMSLIHMVPQLKKKLDWGYFTQERDWTLGRKIPYPRGKVLGGSGAINGLVYVRGDARNYDAWDIDGWRYADLLPHFKAIETFEDGLELITSSALQVLEPEESTAEVQAAPMPIDDLDEDPEDTREYLHGVSFNELLDNMMEDAVTIEPVELDSLPPRPHDGRRARSRRPAQPLPKLPPRPQAPQVHKPTWNDFDADIATDLLVA